MKHLHANSAVLLNRLQNRLSDVSLPQLIRIAIEGSELTDVNLKLRTAQQINSNCNLVTVYSSAINILISSNTGTTGTVCTCMYVHTRHIFLVLCANVTKGGYSGTRSFLDFIRKYNTNHISRYSISKETLVLKTISYSNYLTSNECNLIV